MSESAMLMNKNGVMLLHNPERCVYCGLCEDVCRQLRRALALEIPNLKLKTNLCTACGICAFNCPFGALEFYNDNKKVTIEPLMPRGAIFTAGRCIGCGECAKACPRGAVEVESRIKVVSDECVGCGLCAQNCPTSAIRVNPVNRKVEVDGNLCMFCGSCENVCPKGIIKMRCLSCMLKFGDKPQAQKISNLQVESTVKINRELCIYCGRCELRCPTNSIKVFKPFEGRITIKANKCPENCKICMDFCRCGAIECINGELTINESVCNYCGACHRLCPQKAIDFERKGVDVIDINGRPIIFVP